MQSVLAHRRGLSFRNLSVEVVRRDAALKRSAFWKITG
jgi:hypothetical protein